MSAIVPPQPALYLYSWKKNLFCREAEMIDTNKKYWREKVTAEITLAHMQQFAREAGSTMSAAEIAAFLNQDGRAQGVWMHMMRAGEEYIKASLQANKATIPNVKQSVVRAGMVH